MLYGNINKGIQFIKSASRSITGLHIRLRSWTPIPALLLISLSLHAQELSTFRSYEMHIISDTIEADTLMILPGTLYLLDPGRHPVPDSLYSLHRSGRKFIVDTSLIGQDLIIRYRVVALDLSRPRYLRDPGYIQERSQEPADPFRITAEDMAAGSTYSYADLNRRGSLSRGITFGNGQDVVVNSNLNLQLTGKLGDNLNLVAAISDNNIPIQPEGYSQQISEFDRVYIEVFNEQLRMLAGDFELEGSPGEFMEFYKRAKGGVFRGEFKPGRKGGLSLSTTVSGAVSKGKYSRNSFMGIEGNQGPYKLRGNNFERYIIVLAGTERVYIDGRLMTRGLNNDYVVNYNTAELTFTPRLPITKDRRIIVEFEYSERSYARFLVYASNEFTSGRGTFWLNAYSEQDDRNQTLQQDLSDDDRYILSQAGNDILSAVVPSIDSTGYDPDLVLYLQKDSLVNGTMYENIYEHSNDPDSAVYRLRFSYVGEGNGDYNPVSSTANGKVYRWAAPVNGARQGGYEPVALLITPKKKQVFTAGGHQQLTDITRAVFEVALSNNDPNTFSILDSDQNLGYGLNLGLEQDFLRRDTSDTRLAGFARYRHTSGSFDPVERFRSIEFSRDWNLADTGKQNEHYADFGIGYYSKQSGRMDLRSEILRRSDHYSGARNNLSGDLRFRNFRLELDGSLMDSKSDRMETRFIRHRVRLARHFPFMVVGIREDAEDNRWEATDSLAGNSFAYQEFEVFLNRPDSVQNQAFITYRNRKDFLPYRGSLRYATLGQDLNLGMNLRKNPANRLNAMLTIRDLSVPDTALTIQKPERTVLVRLEHGMQMAGGAIVTSTFYEAGSGLETRKEFSYLEVPAGQGIYQWNDYNRNGIRELDEFEIADFNDQARYIRIFLPSGDYFTVYSNQFNQTIQLDPSGNWKSEEGMKGFLSLFSNQLAYRVSRKTSIKEPRNHLNPFNTVLEDPRLITFSGSVRNNLNFNKRGKVFGAGYIYQKNLNRSLLANGFDTRALESHGFRTRLTLGNGISLTDELNRGNKTSKSEFLSSRDFQIGYTDNRITFLFRLNRVLRFESEYFYMQQVNRPDSQRSCEHDLGTELRYSRVNKGILTTRIRYIHLEYNDDPRSPVAHEMLGSLLPGHNGTWTVLFQRSITGGIELNIQYEGRISQDRPAIHTGSMQIRANF